MNQHRLKERIQALAALHAMAKADLEHAFTDLADAQSRLDTATANEQRIQDQRDAIAAERDRMTQAGTSIAVTGMALLSKQYVNAAHVLMQCQTAATAVRTERDGHQQTVATRRGKLDALQDLQRDNERLLSQLRARKEAALLDDLWLSRKAYEECQS